jgi:hypothetical protein
MNRINFRDSIRLILCENNLWAFLKCQPLLGKKIRPNKPETHSVELIIRISGPSHCCVKYYSRKLRSLEESQSCIILHHCRYRFYVKYAHV